MADINSVPYIPAYPQVVEEMDAVEGAEGPHPAMTHSQSYHIGMSREYRYGARAGAAGPAVSASSGSSGSNGSNGSTSIAKAAAPTAANVQRAEDVPAVPSLQYAATAKVPQAEPLPKLYFSSHSASMVTPEMIEHIEAPDLLPTDFNEDMLLKELSSDSPPPHPSLLFADTAPVAGAVAADRKRRVTPTVKFTLEEAKEASDEKIMEGFTMVHSDNLYGDDEEVDDDESPQSDGEEEDEDESPDEAMDRPAMVRT